MATLFILVGLLPSLLCELPATPIKLSKETTFITEPLAGDGLPNYALAIQAIEAKEVTPEQNGAIPFWQAMGQYQMSDEEFERLSREIGLPTKKAASEQTEEIKTAKQAIKDWLRETGRSSDEVELKNLAEEYAEWVQNNPWTDEDVPSLARWLNENETALDLLVEASKKPKFYSPYPNLLVNRTLSVEDIQLTHVEGVRLAIRMLMTRAMYRIAQDDLEGAWGDCRACLGFSNHLTKSPFVVTQLVVINVRKSALKGVCVILSRPNVSPAISREILEDVTILDGRINVSDAFDAEGRLFALDYVLRMATGRLGGMPLEEKDEGFDKTVSLGVDLNLSLQWVNERFDRIVQVSQIQDRKARVKGIAKLFEDLDIEWQRMRKQAWLGVRSQTFRSNALGQICFNDTYPEIEMVCNKADEGAQNLELVRISAALAVYKAEHSHYPNELAALSPAILKEIPSDLYTAKPLRYKPVGDGYLLYSLFENEADDGGTDVDGEIRDGEWQADGQEVDREKSDLVIRIPVAPRPKP
jgi:hypothetical protein